MMIMLFNLKQRGYEKKHTGISAKSLLLFAIAGTMMHAEIFWSPDTKDAYDIASSSLKDPKAEKLMESASGILNLLVNLLVLYEPVYNTFRRFFFIVSPWFLVILVRHRFFGKPHEIKDKPVDASDKTTIIPLIFFAVIIGTGGVFLDPSFQTLPFPKFVQPEINEAFAKDALKWSGLFLNAIAILPQLQMFRRDGSFKPFHGNGIGMVTHYILFRGKAAASALFFYLLHQKLWEPGNVERALDIFLFKVGSLPPSLSAVVVILSCSLYIPFLVEYMLKKGINWVGIIVIAAGIFVAAETMEQIPAEYSSKQFLDLTSTMTAQSFLRGILETSQVTFVWVGMLEVLLAIWMVFFSGSMGILICVLLVQGLALSQGIDVTGK